MSPVPNDTYIVREMAMHARKVSFIATLPNHATHTVCGPQIVADFSTIYIRLLHAPSRDLARALGVFSAQALRSSASGETAARPRYEQSNMLVR